MYEDRSHYHQHMFTHALLSCHSHSLLPPSVVYVIPAIGDRMLPMALKLTLKPQSQCYIYLADAWWALDDTDSPAVLAWGLAEV